MKVLIGIQARSGSTRLPRKAFELISGRMMLERVIDACKYAAGYIEKGGHECEVIVVTPTGDPIVAEFSRRVQVMEGPELDVLERYRRAVETLNPDYLIRITGDCPLVPQSLISHMMHLSAKNGYDYLSNCDDRVRTSLDGSDVEVISKRLFDYTAEHATRPGDREHVTPFIRRSPPEWAKLGLAFNHFDLSGVKLSVDTPEDLEAVRQQFETFYAKLQEAQKIYGKGAIHRL